MLRQHAACERRSFCTKLLEAVLPVLLPFRHWHLPCLGSLLTAVSYLSCVLLQCYLVSLLQFSQLLLQQLPGRCWLLLIIILITILLVCRCISSLKRCMCAVLLCARSRWRTPWAPGDASV
jgi:hypothetical protein